MKRFCLKDHIQLSEYYGDVYREDDVKECLAELMKVMYRCTNLTKKEYREMELKMDNIAGFVIGSKV